MFEATGVTASSVYGVSAGTPGTMTTAVFGCSIMASENSFRLPGGGKFWPNNGHSSAIKIVGTKVKIIFFMMFFSLLLDS